MSLNHSGLAVGTFAVFKEKADRCVCKLSVAQLCATVKQIRNGGIFTVLGRQAMHKLGQVKDMCLALRPEFTFPFSCEACASHR